MPVIKLPDGTEVWTDEAVEQIPARFRRRFDREKKNKETERQRLERGLGKMAKIGKEFLLADDDDDIGVVTNMLKKAGVIDD